MESLVLDTNVLVFAAEADEEYREDAMYVIMKLAKEEKYRLAVDFESDIINEYKDNLNPRFPYAKMLRELIEKSQNGKGDNEFLKTFPKIPKNKFHNLLEKGFHEHDLKFARVAPKSSLCTIVSEDNESFHKEEFSSWLGQNFDIEIMKLGEWVQDMD